MTTQKRRTIFTCLTLHRMAGIAGALTAATFITLLPVAADPAPNPAHTIANRFAEETQRAEAARETRRKEAARRQAQERRERATKAAKEKSQKAYEAEMLARARAEAAERRELETEAARLDALRAGREAQQAEAERQRTEKARIAAEESLKAEQAKQAAEAQRVAAERAAAEEARKVEEARRIEIARKTEEAARLAETERFAEEARRAEQAAWAAEEAKRVAEIRKAEDMRKAEEGRKAEQIRKASEALRLAAEEATRAEADRLAANARRIADREADAEIERVADRLSRIREEHLARHTAPTIQVTGSTARPTQPTTIEVAERAHEPSSGRGRIAENEGFRDVPLAPPRTRHGEEPRAPQADHSPKYAFDGRVTVLLQMEPRYRRGRRYESMDPVLCVAGGCYVSSGSDQPATFLHGHRAVRFGNAISRRAGACNHAYTCVFRDVNLRELPADVQPVDIRVLRHDRREPERVETLSSCRATTGDRLACTGAIHGDGYTMWVISEAAAERLGPHALDGALDGGFLNSAEADPKLNPWRERW